MNDLPTFVAQPCEISPSTPVHASLPPLNHIRAFESTVRNGSVRKAAKELNITASSVSRHNRLLQEHLGVALFGNSSSQITVTEQGRLLAEGVSGAFEILEDTTQRISQSDFETTLRIACPGIFLNRWLLPRLDRFLRKNSDVELHASHLDGRKRSSVDEKQMKLSISFTRLHSESEVLCPDPILPLLKPALLASIWESRPSPAVRLLCDNEQANVGWQDWFAHLPELQALRTTKLFLDDPDSALEAALQGQGIVLARKSVAREYLESAQLTRFGRPRDVDESFLWYTKPSCRWMNNLEKRFLSWLKAEVHA